MMELKECQAEVFRRSERKIKARKRRKKWVILACIPLVLCVAVFLWRIPLAWDADEAPQSTQGAIGIEMREQLSVSRIDVVWDSGTASLTDAECVRKIVDIVRDASIPYGNRGEENDAENATAPTFVEMGYAITFILDNGESINYCLVGNMLIDPEIPYCLSLSQEQVEQLHSLFGALSKLEG